jgi:hypothetical protein
MKPISFLSSPPHSHIPNTNIIWSSRHDYGAVWKDKNCFYGSFMVYEALGWSQVISTLLAIDDQTRNIQFVGIIDNALTSKCPSDEATELLWNIPDDGELSSDAVAIRWLSQKKTDRARDPDVPLGIWGLFLSLDQTLDYPGVSGSQ